MKVNDRTHIHRRGLVLACAGITACLLLLPDAASAKSKEKFLDFFFGGGGGYEYFNLKSTSAEKILADSVGCSVQEMEAKLCVKPSQQKGNGGLWRVYGGLRLGMVGLSVDYRQSYIEGPISWGQLMGDVWVIFPIPIFKPFIKVGIGWVHLKVKGITLPGTQDSIDGDLIKGLGLRGGAGFLIKPIRWVSIGLTCEATGTYFKYGTEGTWGYAIDLTGHLTIHI